MAGALALIRQTLGGHKGEVHRTLNKAMKEGKDTQSLQKELTKVEAEIKAVDDGDDFNAGKSISSRPLEGEQY